MKYYTFQGVHNGKQLNDGFGAQFQRIIFTIFYSEKNNSEFVYTQINSMEHNYNNDPDFIKKVDEFINIKNNFKTYDLIENKSEVHVFNLDILGTVQKNIDYFINKETTKKYKDIFWSNKNRDYFSNNKFNVSIHIRRPNSHDNRIEGARTPDNYYLEIINEIRNKYKDKELQFHIYSQGNTNDFKCFESEDTVFHIDEDLFSTFQGLVAADVLVTSASSLSYSAAFLSDGEIYYLPFWHPPLENWIVCKNTLI